MSNEQIVLHTMEWGREKLFPRCIENIESSSGVNLSYNDDKSECCVRKYNSIVVTNHGKIYRCTETPSEIFSMIKKSLPDCRFVSRTNAENEIENEMFGGIRW